MTMQTCLKSALLLAVLAASAACDSASDTGSSGCECSSLDDNYCDGQSAMQCDDGCHFTKTNCGDGGDDGYGYCADGECDYYSYNDDTDGDDPECWDALDNYCLDGSTLVECKIFDDEWDNYYEEVNCADPAVCPGVGGCALGDDGIAACWCDEGDGGVDGGK